MSDDDAKRGFLTGARMKLDGQHTAGQGQALMEAAAWELVDAGHPKAEVPGLLAVWAADESLDTSTLGIRKDTIIKQWLSPRNRREGGA